MRAIFTEIKQTARLAMKRHTNITLKVIFVIMIVYVFIELIRYNVSPVIVLSENAGISEYLEAYLHFRWSEYLIIAMVWVLQLIVISPLICVACSFSLEVTTAKRLFSKDEMPALKLSEFFRWFITSKERTRAIKLNLLVSLIMLALRILFCGAPIFLLYTLRGNVSSELYINSLITYSLGLLAGYLITYVIQGRFYAAYFLICQDPDITVRDAVKESFVIMKGHIWEFFRYKLSFFPWILLSVITFGIGAVFLLPYRIISDAIFIRYCDAGGKPVWERENGKEW
jgi:uncharacterized membrane protein